MEMKNYIEKAEKKAGKQTELANMLGITASYIRMVKAGKKGFPIEICIVLADYINEDRLEVIAASNLVTEKDERKRKIFESCFSRAASVTAAAVIISILTLAPQQTVNARNLSNELSQIYIIGNCRRMKLRRKSDLLSELFYNFLAFFQRGGSLSY